MIPPSSSNSEVQRHLDAQDRLYAQHHPVTASVPEAPAAADRAPGTCETCSHPWSSHDPISVRFCTATLNGGYRRACVCSTKETG